MENFRKKNNLQALEDNFIELIIPNNPNDPNQKYKLTGLKSEFQKRLIGKKLNSKK